MFIVVLYGNAMNNLHDLNAEYKYHYIGCKLCILVIAPKSHINKSCDLLTLYSGCWKDIIFALFA